MENKGLVISGGGAWGAFGAGTLAGLNKNYDTVVGISTGALMAPLVALNKWNVLKQAYCTITQDDIFDKCWYKFKPISKNGKIRKFPIILSLLLGDKSVATSNNLRGLIDDFFTEEDYKKLLEKNKEIFVGTQNYAEEPSSLHYFSSKVESYNDFKDWMWCSANAPFFTSLVKKKWQDNDGTYYTGQWTDGGITELVAVDKIMSLGTFSEVDIIVHRERTEKKFEGHEANNLINNITRSVEAMRYDIAFENLNKTIQSLNNKGTDVRIYWLPRKLSTNPLYFNKEIMKQWWYEGYTTANDPQRIDYFPGG